LQGDVVTVGTRDSLAIAQSRLLALVGLEDAVVVETPDAVLVAHMENTRGDETFLVSENESTFIPEIIRFDDAYGRGQV
jgi:hypothetical protein